ncbi:MAG TPA: twin-arginine translocation signal domain-containing protein [Actinospica sp.]|jgi:putative aldouronate transport system substrate-binding protein|nr:twin-arginine translocation signal domain-containing protein [Actinospica sp.]
MATGGRSIPAFPASGVSRRNVLRTTALGAGAAAFGVPLLSACGGSSSANGGVSASGLKSSLPDYVPLTGGVTPDIPSVAGVHGAVTDAGYLSYPTNLVKSVSEVPGSGGSYTGVTPLWGSIPTAGNGYYQAVNKALGANVTMTPANGATYNTAVPTLVAGNKLPDWIQLPTWWNSTFNVGELAASKFADLTPYLSGSNIRKYPNLAAIPTGGWQVGAWEGKLYGIPSFTSGQAFAGVLFYRQDIFESKGINPDDVKTADDLYSLGAELTAPKAGVWAFDVLSLMTTQIFNVPFGMFHAVNGKLQFVCDTEENLASLEYCYKLAKSGYVHPDALAGNTNNAGQRFYSGKELVGSGGTGAWNVMDAQQGQAANPKYKRGAFKLFSNDGSTPTIGLGAATSEVSYLNKSLSKSQIEECLRIANYLAAPFGSYEYTLINYGVEGTDWTTGKGGPTYTSTGQKEANEDTYQFLCSPQNAVSNPGYSDITTAYCAWSAEAVKYAYKPLFADFNISVPTRFATAAAAAELTDVTTQISYGTKTMSDYAAAVKSWKAGGGNALLAWYQTNVYDKYGAGQ